MRIRFSRLLLFLATLPLSAQQPITGATLTGTIICADTSAPARFAKVMLRPAAIDSAATDAYIQDMQKRMEQVQTQSRTNNSASAPTPFPPTTTQLQQQRTAINRQLSNQSEQSNSTAADVNGHYSITGIAPGIYYVHAEMPGYVDALDQFTFDEITSGDQNTTKRIAQSAPLVSIAGTESQRIDLRLERGASITGRVLYDDGSPAAGWLITPIPQRMLTGTSADMNQLNPTMLMFSGFSGIGINGPPPRTDDLGNFRISGLAAGTYTLRAALMASQPGVRGNIGMSYNLTIYNGDTLHLSDAKTFTLASGQVHSGTDISVQLHTLHNVSGRVVAPDGHGINSGQIVLSTRDDTSYHLQAPLAAAADGSFQLYSVAPGTYTITGAALADTKTTVTKTPTSTRSSTQSLYRYATARSTITVGDADITDITLTAPELKNQPANGDAIISQSESSY